MAANGKLVYGTTIALGQMAALISGPSGSGKSDVALRFLSLNGILSGSSKETPMLVADDQTKIFLEDGNLMASAPTQLAGKIEVRGIGIIDVPYRKNAVLSMAVDLVSSESVPRLPNDPLETKEFLGVCVPIIQLAAFEASTPLKIFLALSKLANKAVDNTTK